MKRLFTILLCALALSPASDALAQNGTASAPTYRSAGLPRDAQGVFMLDANGNPTGPSAPAVSTPCVVSATSSTITPTGCLASGSAGSYVAGPFTAQPGYAVRVIATGTWAGSIAVGTSATAGNCTTVNPLTVAGQSWGSFTGNANEAVDVPPTTGSLAYCLTITVTSGTLSATLRQ